jgi:hypothetical protein
LLRNRPSLYPGTGSAMRGDTVDPSVRQRRKSRLVIFNFIGTEV